MHNKAAPGLLLVHGFGAHSYWWDACAPYLARDYRVVAMDLAGMGDSGHRDHYSQQQYADDIAAVIEHADLGPALVVGHSFGGIMTTWAAHLHPKLIRGAIIVDSRLALPDENQGKGVAEQRPKRTYPDYDSARARFRLIPEENTTPPALFEHIARHSLRQVDGSWQWKFDDAITSSLPAPPRAEAELLREMEMPIAMVCGELSNVVPADYLQRLQRYLPDGQAPVMIPEAHHHVLLDQPLVLVVALRALLSEMLTSRS